MLNVNNCGSLKRTTIIFNVLGISQSIVYYFMNFSVIQIFSDPQAPSWRRHQFN